MPTRKERILEYVAKRPGKTDREITDAVDGRSAGQQAVNQACHQLTTAGVLERRKRDDGRIGNYPTGKPYDPLRSDRKTNIKPTAGTDRNALQEDEIKARLDAWLRNRGWSTDIAWGQAHGVDICANKGDQRWIIEAKGCGSRQPMRVNYFLAVLGEALQRMDDPCAKYSIALPDMVQFRRLWDRLPTLAKGRTKITVLFVEKTGNVREDR